jgi:hypothetical protein
MLCSPIDMSSLGFDAKGQPVVSPPDSAADIYRPMYNLSEFDRFVNQCITDGRKNSDSIRIPLNLTKAATLPWSNLGFPSMDKKSPNGTPDINPEIWRDFVVTLKLTALQSFDVHRGLW